MSDNDFRRLERDLEELIIRVRAIENASSPYAQQMIAEFRALQAKVQLFTEEGTPVSRRELGHVQARMGELKASIDLKADERDLRDLEEETRANRTMVRSALIAASLALGSGIILFVVQRAIR